MFLDDFNFPEPDTAVVRGQPRDYMQRTPTADDVLLVVEVTVTSHARDRRKAGTYARARVAEYWMLDVEARTLTVHRESHGQRHGSVTVMGEQDVALPPGAHARLAVREMLP